MQYPTSATGRDDKELQRAIDLLAANNYIVLDTENDLTSVDEKTLVNFIGSQEDGLLVAFRIGHTEEISSVQNAVEAHKIIVFDATNQEQFNVTIDTLANDYRKGLEDALADLTFDPLRLTAADQPIAVADTHAWTQDLQEVLDEGLRIHAHKLPELIREKLNL